MGKLSELADFLGEKIEELKALIKEDPASKYFVVKRIEDGRFFCKGDDPAYVWGDLAFADLFSCFEDIPPDFVRGDAKDFYKLVKVEKTIRVTE